MPKQIVIAEQHRIAAVFAEDQIQELIVATGTHQVGDIYLGSVENVLPGIDAAFVNLGDSDRNGFMHVTDLGPLRLKRTAGSITELLAPQQKVLVQIMKEPTGNKGPRLTGNVTLPGRYLVLMPYGRGVNLSRRIRSETERNRLRALAILIKPAGMGLLVRTEADGVPEEAIIEDLETLQKQWELTQQEALTTRPPALLNRDDDFIQRVLRDVYSADVNRIVADSHTGMKRVKQQLTNWGAGRMPQGVLVDHHRERAPLLEFFRVNAAIREALKPRVDLPSGGYIVIEPTEALTVIDVNSGSFTRSATARETVLWTNCEAAMEIARQLRLRNVAGVIIVDFIDMDSRRDKLQVLESFNRALREDKSRPQISQLSELGLVELTRKRQGQNIYELFGRPCSTCGGSGHLVHLPGETGDKDASSGEPSREISAGGRFSHPSLRENGSENLEPHADLQELELMHHPSYQERGGKTNNRRRRRREVPAASKSNGRPELPKPVAVTSDIKEPKEVKAAASYSDVESPSASPRNNRSRGRGERKAAPLPEVITVEMTSDEQRVYALMGISPLVLSNQSVNDSKNVSIAVTLPGQGEASPPIVTFENPVNTKVLPSITETVEKETASNNLIKRSEPTPIPLKLSVETQQSAQTQDDNSVMEQDSSSGTTESALPRRRRRRRSSAESNDGVN
jgi:ribonuclease E